MFGADADINEPAEYVVFVSVDTNTNTITQIREDSGSYRTGSITLQSGSNVTISEPSTGVFNIANWSI
jgi:hypothetical protein